MRQNHTLERLRRGETVLGCALQQYRSAEIPRLYAAAGFDYLFIDVEHSAFDMETVQDMINAAVAARITPLVRVSDLQYSLVSRYLDIGAQGIVLPRVESPEILQQAVRWMHYPPAGCRGFGMMAPQLDYQGGSMREIIAHQNANLLLVMQVESALALERCRELIAVEGVHVVMIGPSDLSISLGIPGEFEHPDFIRRIEDFVHLCQDCGVVPGIHCRTAEQAQFWLQKGMRFVGAGGEHGMLQSKACEVVQKLRQGQPQPL